MNLRLNNNPASFRCGSDGHFVNKTTFHVIPIKNGGSNEWWNMIPVEHPHTGTIHGKDSALRKHMPYQKQGGKIWDLLGR
ncbi:HNH endonuclease signature motif containing protein [Pectobacterium versatile]|uniref:HNH endonuclease signature motif containing protein n=1 Tax=Pectobacterium versatile TaxID=2488639 RepID=UPI003AFA89DE